MRSEIIKKYEKMKKQDLIDVLVNMEVKESPAIGMPSDIYKELVKLLTPIEMIEKESFFSITLNGAHNIIDCHVVSKGLANRTLVHPREVFRPAIQDNAVAVVIAHNHPSGCLDPSPEDRDVTKRIKEAGGIIGIKVLDHLIFSDRGYKSMLESCLF